MNKIKEALQEGSFYEKPWFWICLAIIVFCITRPFMIVICGNNNGNDSANTR